MHLLNVFTEHGFGGGIYRAVGDSETAAPLESHTPARTIVSLQLRGWSLPSVSLHSHVLWSSRSWEVQEGAAGISHSLLFSCEGMAMANKPDLVSRKQSQLL